MFSQTMLNNAEFRARVTNTNSRLQEIGRLWKELPQYEKDEYAEKLKQVWICTSVFFM